MYIEKRRLGNSIKYYLVHSYREKGQVKKLRRFLGRNLSPGQLDSIKESVSVQIRRELELFNTEVFEFSLTPKQVQRLNKMDKIMEICHLEEFDWKLFPEQFTYHTNAIEGSTVKLDEVPKILHKEKVSDEEEIETQGVAASIDYVKRTKEELSLKLILNIHNICFKGSKHFAGKFRDVEVVIRNARGEIIHRGVPASEVKDHLEELAKWYKINKKRFKPLVLAALIHNQFEDIHPFQDGNGRGGRLLLNYILIKNNYPPINISLEDRQIYYSSLQEYHKSHDIKPTLQFLVNQYKKTLKQVPTKCTKK